MIAAVTWRLISVTLIDSPVASYVRSGLKSSASNRRLRLVATSSRSASPTRGRNAVRVASSKRWVRSWIDCLTRCSAAIEPRCPAPLPRRGTILVREWQGTTHHVTVGDEGFLWNGRTYRSLSGIARAITGTNWNGPRFFGMREMNGKTRERRRGG